MSFIRIKISYHFQITFNKTKHGKKIFVEKRILLPRGNALFLGLTEYCFNQKVLKKFALILTVDNKFVIFKQWCNYRNCLFTKYCLQ